GNLRADGSRGEAVHGVDEDLLVADARADRIHRHGQFAGDLRPGQVRREISQHLELARAELLPSDPETSAVRKRWARATVAVLDGQSAPRIRRIARGGQTHPVPEP